MLKNIKNLSKLILLLTFILLISFSFTACENGVINDNKEVVEEPFTISGQILDLDEKPLESYDSVTIKLSGVNEDYIINGEEDINNDGSWELIVDERVSVEISSDDYKFISGKYQEISSENNNINFYGYSINAEVPDYYNLDLSQEEFIRIDANENKGFNYGFYLRIPREATENQGAHMFVESNNSGRHHDDIEFHDKYARQKAKNYLLADEFNTAVLIPVFPRPYDIDFYTHALGEGNFNVSENKPYYRLDKQLISMVDHAMQILKYNGLNLDNQIFLNGYSASGLFVNRFAKIYPERVRAVVAGGIAGSPLTPNEEYKGHRINYPIGVADFEELTGKSFNIEAYREVAKYYYMGYLDKNDGVGGVADEIFGEEIIYDRWEGSQEVYEKADVPAQFVTYNNTFHEIKPEMTEDIIRFFEENKKNGFVEIDPYEYDYLEYKELESVLIEDAIWVGDPDMPERLSQHIVDNTHFMIIVDDIFEDFDVYSQLYVFKDNAGFNFKLESSKNEIYIDENDFNVTAHDNGEDLIAGIEVALSEDKLEKIEYGLKYDFIIINNEDDNYKWITNDDITLVPVKD